MVQLACERNFVKIVDATVAVALLRPASREWGLLRRVRTVAAASAVIACLPHRVLLQVAFLATPSEPQRAVAASSTQRMRLAPRRSSTSHLRLMMDLVIQGDWPHKRD